MSTTRDLSYSRLPLGERALDEYDTFIQELYDAYDFQTWLDICSEQLIEQGLAK